MDTSINSRSPNTIELKLTNNLLNDILVACSMIRKIGKRLHIHLRLNTSISSLPLGPFMTSGYSIFKAGTMTLSNRSRKRLRHSRRVRALSKNGIPVRKLMFVYKDTNSLMRTYIRYRIDDEPARRSFLHGLEEKGKSGQKPSREDWRKIFS